MPMVKRKSGELALIVGASQSGKTASAKQRVQRADRLLVWDHEGNWINQALEARTFGHLVQLLKNDPTSPLRVAFHPPSPSRALFHQWARAAYLWGQLAPCDVVAEELAEFMSPGKAGDGWGSLVRTGAKYGINITAITQSPAESDKTIIRNASVIRCFRMGWESDDRYMANALKVPVADVSSLGHLEYIEVHPRATPRRVVRGKLTF